MTGRLFEAVGRITGLQQVLHDDLGSFIRECLHWIIHLIHTVYDSCLHFLAEVFRALGRLFGSDFREACATVWSHIEDVAIYLYEGIKNCFDHVADACSNNDTCSSIARETKDFTVYWFHQFESHIGVGSLVVCTAVVIILYLCISKIIVWIVRCCGFSEGGIRSRTPASSYMARYGGYVLPHSNCSRLQSIGATGEVYKSESGRKIRRLMAFAFAATIFFFVVLWCVTHDDED